MSVLGFELEWFDQVSGILQTLYLKFFLDNNTIELLHNNSIFLKRIYYPEVKLEDLYIGNSITIYNRLLSIKKYANTATTEFMNSCEARFLAVVDKNGLSDVSKLLLLAKTFKLTLGRVITTSSSFNHSELSVKTGDCLVEMIGLNVSNTSKFIADACKISRYVSVIMERTDAISEILSSSKCVRVQPNVTLCLIKPHVIKSQLAGEVLQTIGQDKRFRVVGLYSTHLTIPLAEELLDVYRGVLQNYTLTLEHVCSAPLLAVMITSASQSAYEDVDVVTQFRDIVGPVNPQLATVVRPGSLRALYGQDLVKNAVHCTDLPEDGEMECTYIFETVASL